jgi:UDP-N-acetylglucosamine 2-epimerase
VTLREETEWVETVASGSNRLVGLDSERALSALAELTGRWHDSKPDPSLYGDGNAGSRCVDELFAWIQAEPDVPPRRA